MKWNTFSPFKFLYCFPQPGIEQIYGLSREVINGLVLFGLSGSGAALWACARWY